MINDGIRPELIIVKWKVNYEPLIDCCVFGHLIVDQVKHILIADCSSSIELLEDYFFDWQQTIFLVSIIIDFGRIFFKELNPLVKFFDNAFNANVGQLVLLGKIARQLTLACFRSS